MSSLLKSLRIMVLDFATMARKRPAIASDPAELDRLEEAALSAMDGAQAALHAPVANFTWEMGTVLLGSQPVSDRVLFEMPEHASILGFRPSVHVLTTGGAGTPDADAIEVQIDVNGKNYMTNFGGPNNQGTGGAIPRDGNFVTLASIGIQTPRLTCWNFPRKAVRSTIGMTFRWKDPTASRWHDTNVRVGIFARSLDEDDR